MNPGKNLETMKRFDESFRLQSHKILDKFRKIRYSPKSTPEGKIKLNDVCNTMANEQDNPSTLMSIKPEDITMRRQSTLPSPLEFQLQANTILKPKVNLSEGPIYSILFCLLVGNIEII